MNGHLHTQNMREREREIFLPTNKTIIILRKLTRIF